jgi:hypothetical protein
MLKMDSRNDKLKEMASEKMSWRSPMGGPNLNILQKDGESQIDTVKTPYLDNFEINSPDLGSIAAPFSQLNQS